MVSVPVFVAVSFWLVYVALEPYLRRNWPDAMVSWTRLCHGHIHDPVVASHVLVAIVAAEAFGLIVRPGFTILSGGFSVVQLGATEFTFLLRQTLLMLALGLAFTLVAALLRQFIRSPLPAGLCWPGCLPSLPDSNRTEIVPSGCSCRAVCSVRRPWSGCGCFAGLVF